MMLVRHTAKAFGSMRKHGDVFKIQIRALRYASRTMYIRHSNKRYGSYLRDKFYDQQWRIIRSGDVSHTTNCVYLERDN